MFQSVFVRASDYKYANALAARQVFPGDKVQSSSFSLSAKQQPKG